MKFGMAPVIVVRTLDTLLAYRRGPHENLVRFPRRIQGDFNGLARWLHERDPYNKMRVAGGTHFVETRYPAGRLQSFKDELGLRWRKELDVIVRDMRAIEETLRTKCELSVAGPEGDHPGNYKFHKDILEHDRLTCCYNASAEMEWIPAKDAVACAGDNPADPVPYYKKRDDAKSQRLDAGDIWRYAPAGDDAGGLILRSVEVKPGNPPALRLIG